MHPAAAHRGDSRRGLDTRNCPSREVETRRLDLVAQDGEVVIVPETVGKRMGPALESLEAAGSHGLEKLGAGVTGTSPVCGIRAGSRYSLPFAPPCSCRAPLDIRARVPDSRPTIRRGSASGRAVSNASYRLPHRWRHVLVVKSPAAKRPAMRRQTRAHDS